MRYNLNHLKSIFIEINRIIFRKIMCFLGFHNPETVYAYYSYAKVRHTTCRWCGKSLRTERA